MEITPAFEPTKGTPNVHSELGVLYLPLEGLVDAAAEKVRLTKELEKIEIEITKVQQKLGNANFTAKAPPQVLQEHQQRLTEWQTKRDRVKSSLDGLA